VTGHTLRKCHKISFSKFHLISVLCSDNNLSFEQITFFNAVVMPIKAGYLFFPASLKEVKRVPMKKPSGKYNVHNKITRSEGTSH